MERVLRKLKARFQVDIHPSNTSNILEGVRSHMNALLLRYEHAAR